VAKAALLAMLLDLQFAVWEERHRDFAVTCFFRHEHSDIVLVRRFASRVTEICHWACSRFVLVNERQLDFEFAVSEREDFYFTLAFNIAIRAVGFGGGDAAFTGSGGRHEKSRNEESEKDCKNFDPERFRGRYRRGLGHARSLLGHFILSNVFTKKVGSVKNA